MQYTNPNWFILHSDSSDIEADWHAWMHYMTDETPVSHPKVEQKFHMEHRRNNTHVFTERYVASTTTKPKIEPWTPNITTNPTIESPQA